MNISYFKSLLKSSLGDFKRNKVRTVLTSLGILIGVMSVVLLIALGLGLKNYISGQFESLGTNLLIVFPGKLLGSSGGFSSSSSIGTIQFDERDVTNLKRAKLTEYVVPVFEKTVKVKSVTKDEYTNIYGTTADMFPIRNYELSEGSFFTDTDSQRGARKAVIGSKIAEKLFPPNSQLVGKKVRIENVQYSIVGVLKSKGGGGFGGPDFDSVIYVPYKSAISLNPNKSFISIYLKAKDEKDISSLKEEAKTILIKRYKEDDFSIIEQTEILNAVNQIFSVLNIVLIAIGSISLLVGGVGIMNIMYASVTERTKEIGIRRAIGATKNDILVQFLSESVILSLFGGTMALILSVLIVLLIRPIFPASLNLVAVILAIGISGIIGVFFGVFPAKKAANLSPIDAIRYE